MAYFMGFSFPGGGQGFNLVIRLPEKLEPFSYDIERMFGYIRKGYTPTFRARGVSPEPVGDLKSFFHWEEFLGSLDDEKVFGLWDRTSPEVMDYLIESWGLRGSLKEEFEARIREVFPNFVRGKKATRFERDEPV